MKKIWFILLIICAACLGACSDDDNNVNTGEIPVKGYVLPPFVRLGTEMVIPGKGFSPDAQLFVKNEAGDLIPIPTEKITSSGILFTVPTTLERGNYDVVLKQDGEWVMGTWAVKDIVKVKRLKSVAWDFGGGFLMSCDLKYDYENRLTSFLSIATSTVYTLTYEDDHIDVTGLNTEDDSKGSFTLYVNDGRIVSSISNGETAEWSYSDDGYLKEIGRNQYTFEEGNLITTTYNDEMVGDGFMYGDPEWVTHALEADIAACSMYFNGGMEDRDFLAFLLGMNGKKSRLLPTVFFGSDFTYVRENNEVQGLVKEAILTMPGVGELLHLVFSYETAEVLL